jgi:hypothetical protein
MNKIKKRRGKYTTHNEQYLHHQNRYLNGETKALEDMYNVLKQMSFNLVNNYVKSRNLHRIYNYETIKEKAHDISTTVIMRYVKEPGFEITSSPSGYVRNGAFLKYIYTKDPHHHIDLFSQIDFNEHTQYQEIWKHSSDKGDFDD